LCDRSVFQIGLQKYETGRHAYYAIGLGRVLKLKRWRE
jgi:hypothetical protein